MEMDRQGETERGGRPPPWGVTGILLCLLCLSGVGGQIAKSSYYMDSQSDCNIAGFMLLQQDNVVNVNSRRAGSSSSEILQCSLRFRPEDNRDIMDVSFTDLTISDPGVTLRVELTGAETHNLVAGSSTPSRMTSEGGQVTISLSRLSFSDHNYAFGIILRVYREDDSQVASDERPIAVGLVVGIVAGVIIFLIFIAILVVCCRRKMNRYVERDDHKQDLTSHTLTHSRSFGQDNMACNGTSPPRGGKDLGEHSNPSPPFKKKNIIQNESTDPSGSESDAKDQYIVRDYDRSPTKPAAMRYESENSRRAPQQGNSHIRRGRREDERTEREETGNRRNEKNQREEAGNRRNERNQREETENRRNQNLPQKSPILSALHDNPRFRAASNAAGDVSDEDIRPRRGQREGRTPREENSGNQTRNLPPKSPILSALHSNPRFRASFHATEQEAEERIRRISGGHDDAGHESDVSMTETWNTTFDTNFDDDPRPPQHTFVKPPTLPPVPKSPKSPLRREKTASIHRTPRPTSTSSEIEQLQGGEGDKEEAGNSGSPEGEGPPSPSEVVAIRVQDPHSPSIKRKADTQHTLRPDRGKGKNSAKQNKKTPDSRKPETDDSQPTAAKPGAKKDRGKLDRTEAKSQNKETRTKPSEATGKSSNGAQEYEGRFKKSDSVRKSKSKSPRIGRSRSTGTAMEDTDSVGRPSTPSGYRAVPSVTADDYEDSDMESNYNPLRRTGSKGSLYASRSSLYSRRRRKNSGGESVYSYAQDDMDFDDRDRDSFKQRGLSRRNRSARSLGDLEVELRDQATRSTQTLRECATQTGAGFANVSPGKKTVVKKTKPRSVSSSQTQTVKSKPRNLDSSSSSSGIARPRERKNSASSASGRSRSKERKKSERPKRNKSETSLKDFADAAEESSRSGTPRDKPKPKARKRTTGSTGQLSDDDLESVRTGMTGPVDQSSVVGGGHVNPAMLGQPAMYPPQGYPGYQMGYPGQMAYMHATGQPPVMSFPPSVPAQPGAGAPNHMSTPAPGIAPKPQVSKWDMLCRMTGGDAAQGGDAYETGSVAGSVLSNPYSIQQFPPGYSSAMSDYAGSERSGPTRSMAGRSRSSRAQGRSAWDTLREMTDQEYEGSQYAPSVSNV